MQAEHTLLEDPNEEFKVGDQFQLVVAMQDALVNRWDRYVGIRNDVVERVIEIAARGPLFFAENPDPERPRAIS